MNKAKSRVIALLLAVIVLLLPIATVTACAGASASTSAPDTVIQMEDVSPEDWFYRYVVAGLRFFIVFRH